MATIAVVSTAAQVITEVQAAKAQKKAITAQLAEAEGEIRTAETADLNDRAREARREQARIKVAAGEAGLQLGSGSLEAMLLDSVMQQELAGERTSLNAENQLHAARAEANSQYSRVSQPTLLGAGLRIAVSGVSGYAAGAGAASAKQAASSKAAALTTSA
ncbi:hypothetical protein [Caulobacter sp.]|uniref:virion core protein, T7 gp14 family n=1 Tax=Caulobacter sp. TaxID=78 RepID=UPI0031E245EA